VDKTSEKSKKLKIQIKVVNYDEGCIYMWDMKKFSNRYFIIKDILDNYFETNELTVQRQEDDPFWDPPEPYFIG
jgi:recombinational DNA repair protein RecR